MPREEPREAARAPEPMPQAPEPVPVVEEVMIVEPLLQQEQQPLFALPTLSTEIPAYSYAMPQTTSYSTAYPAGGSIVQPMQGMQFQGMPATTSYAAQPQYTTNYQGPMMNAGAYAAPYTGAAYMPTTYQAGGVV